MNQTLPLLFFGKLPSRGDFVRSSTPTALIHSLDKWLSAGMELMAEDVHWKTIYDAADAAYFAMVSPHRHTGVAGYLMPSADLSGRRFPFLTACAIDSCNGGDLLSVGPLMLQPAWTQLSSAAVKARQASEHTVPVVLGDMGHEQIAGPLLAEQARQQYQRLLQTTTLATLVQDLSHDSVPCDVRQILLALGLLLQPVMNSVGQPIDKGLRLPLPQDEYGRFAVATFWMDMVSRFLVRSPYDLTLFMPRGVNHRPCLMIGFSAGAAHVLQGLLDPRSTDHVFLSLDESPWVEPYVDNDYALKKLSSYLLMPQMSLAQVLTSFQEAFIGS
jgi:type VI secretion system protein ImpM